MEGRHGTLLRITFALNFLLLFLSFTGVTSAPAAPTIMSVMKNDSKLCEMSKSLCDLKEMQDCAKLPYPYSESIDSHLNFNEILLCLGWYDTAYKICQYSNKDLMNNISLIINSYIKQITDRESQVKFCKDLKGYTFSDTNFPTNISKYFSKLSEILNEDKICLFECFRIDNKLYPLCAILYWIKNIDNNQTEKIIKAGTEQNVTPNNPKDQIISIDKTKSIENKKILEENETEKHILKLTTTLSNNNNRVILSDNVVTASTKGDAEKKSEVVNENGIQKKVNKMETQNNKSMLSVSEEKEENIPINLGTNTEDTKFVKNPANSKPQPASVKDLTDSTPEKKVANEENAQQHEKEQDDAKTTTISENTQDDPNEDVESNRADMDDMNDVISQPEDLGKEALSEGNQNDILQEISGQKDRLQYSTTRIEDESHFFTYFTVITVVCIVGYIGYHNKQKILAIVLEGRRSRSSRSRRRPSTANYRKLDCTLEEAVTSQCNANVTHVIY